MYFAKTLDEACENGLQKVDRGGVLCLYCSTTWPDRSKGRKHIEAKHFQTEGYQCELCYSYCKTKHALECHMSKKHRIQK